MCRYVERCGNTSRLLDINLRYLLEAEDRISEGDQWRPLLSITGSAELYDEIYDGMEVSSQRTLQFLTRERRNPNSILRSLQLARENARVARDRISREMWEAINHTWLHLERAMQQQVTQDRAPALFAEVRDGVARFHGFTVSTMTRGEAFGFYLLGTLLERADMTARILDVKYHILLPDVSMVGSALDYYQWAALLRSTSGFDEYRQRYQTGLRPVDIVEFLVFDRGFPRSLRFAISRMRDALTAIGPPAVHYRWGDAISNLEALIDETCTSSCRSFSRALRRSTRP